MDTQTQSLVTLIVVALAVLSLVRGLFGKSQKGNPCGGGCGCAIPTQAPPRESDPSASLLSASTPTPLGPHPAEQSPHDQA